MKWRPGAPRAGRGGRAGHEVQDYADGETALHLLDILFSQENPSAEALQLGIEIHEALQPESQNFWLSAWLRNEAEKLGKRLKAV